LNYIEFENNILGAYELNDYQYLTFIHTIKCPTCLVSAYVILVQVYENKGLLRRSYDCKLCIIILL